MTDYRVMVTGSRKWDAQMVVENALMAAYGVSLQPEYDRMVVVHGGAVGADKIAKNWADRMEMYGFAVVGEEHLPDYDKYPPKRAPLVRNAEMARSGISICLAFPLEGGTGTRHAMTQCVREEVQFINYGYQPYTREAREFAW